MLGIDRLHVQIVREGKKRGRDDGKPRPDAEEPHQQGREKRAAYERQQHESQLRRQELLDANKSKRRVED